MINRCSARCANDYIRRSTSAIQDKVNSINRDLHDMDIQNADVQEDINTIVNDMTDTCNLILDYMRGNRFW